MWAGKAERLSWVDCENVITLEAVSRREKILPVTKRQIFKSDCRSETFLHKHDWSVKEAKQREKNIVTRLYWRQKLLCRIEL